jgi:hypothetical protein
VPRFFAATASGANFLIGDSGISSPRTDISGIFCKSIFKLVQNYEKT